MLTTVPRFKPKARLEAAGGPSKVGGVSLSGARGSFLLLLLLLILISCAGLRLRLRTEMDVRDFFIGTGMCSRGCPGPETDKWPRNRIAPGRRAGPGPAPCSGRRVRPPRAGRD